MSLLPGADATLCYIHCLVRYHNTDGTVETSLCELRETQSLDPVLSISVTIWMTEVLDECNKKIQQNVEYPYACVG